MCLVFLKYVLNKKQFVIKSLHKLGNTALMRTVINTHRVVYKFIYSNN